MTKKDDLIYYPDFEDKCTPVIFKSPVNGKCVYIKTQIIGYEDETLTWVTAKELRKLADWLDEQNAKKK